MRSDHEQARRAVLYASVRVAWRWWQHVRGFPGASVGACFCVLLIVLVLVVWLCGVCANSGLCVRGMDCVCGSRDDAVPRWPVERGGLSGLGRDVRRGSTWLSGAANVMFCEL